MLSHCEVEIHARQAEPILLQGENTANPFFVILFAADFDRRVNDVFEVLAPLEIPTLRAVTNQDESRQGALGVSVDLFRTNLGLAVGTGLGLQLVTKVIHAREQVLEGVDHNQLILVLLDRFQHFIDIPVVAQIEVFPELAFLQTHLDLLEAFFAAVY